MYKLITGNRIILNICQMKKKRENNIQWNGEQSNANKIIIRLHYLQVTIDVAARNPPVTGHLSFIYVKIDKLMKFEAVRLQSNFSNGRHECDHFQYANQLATQQIPHQTMFVASCRLHISGSRIEIFFFVGPVHFSLWRRRHRRRCELFMRLMVMKYLHRHSTILFLSIHNVIVFYI